MITGQQVHQWCRAIHLLPLGGENLKPLIVIIYHSVVKYTTVVLYVIEYKYNIRVTQLYNASPSIFWYVSYDNIDYHCVSEEK